MKALKTMILVAFIAASAWMLQGCAAFVPTPMGLAGFYSNVTCPTEALALECNANVGQDKVGMASATNILGIISTGDNSIAQAMKNGNIKKVHHVDIKIESVLGFYVTKTMIVYGQ